MSKPHGIGTTLQQDFEFANEKSRYMEASRELDLRNEEELRRFAWWDQDSVELVVGVDLQSGECQKLTDLISEEEGKITDIVSIGGVIRAYVVKVPIDKAYIFASKLETSRLVKYVEANTIVKVDFVPNDPNWAAQWGLKKIEADWAWNESIGSSSILAAIIDTGIDYTHEDLSSNYVPLGYDWVNNDADPLDDHGHGTHCAGIIAAVTNNNIGVAGLAQVRVMMEKVFNANGYGTWNWVADALVHATNMGAKIISMSLGGDIEPPEFVYEAVKYAYAHGVLLVASAGNEAMSRPIWPAYYNEVIAVTAIDGADKLASFSSYGDWVELTAPGVGVYSTYKGNSYAYDSGTSMACPHVSGVAALAWGVFPNYTRDQLRNLLRYTADDLGTPGFDEYYGYGRINARKAVEGLPEHELKITKWECARRLDPDRIVVFNATVFNFGVDNQTSVTARLIVNDTLVNSKYLSFFQEGTFTTMSFSWSTSVRGNYNLTCYVVPVEGESRMENNGLSAEVFVRYPTALEVPFEYPTIEAALNHTGSYDTILVSGGFYAEEQIDIVKDQEGISLIGDGNATIDGLRHRSVLRIMANHVTVKGLIVQNSCRGAEDVGILVTDCYNVTIVNNTIRDNYYSGVYLRNSVFCNISSNTITANDHYAVYLRDFSCNNTVHSNNVVDNFMWGICIEWSSSNNVVSQNNISRGWLGGWAVQIGFASGNLIYLNNIKNNTGGVHLAFCSDNIVSLNNISDNSWEGIHLDGTASYPCLNNLISSNNINASGTAFEIEIGVANCVNGTKIFHNNFIRPQPRVYSECDVMWDDGYPSGGNYWAGYNVVDEYSGLNQDELGSDGIGDTPYLINIYNIDKFPLMGPSQTFTAYTWDKISYDVIIASNSTAALSGFDRQNCTLSFEVTGADGTVGFSRVAIPKSLMWCDTIDEWMVTVGTEPIQPKVTEDDNNTYIYVAYGHSARTIQVRSTHTATIHNIAVTYIKPHKTVTVQSFSLFLNVTIINKGMYPETFQVSFSANLSTIETLPVVLTSLEQQTITFTWNTTGFAKGSYTLSANAWPVPDETYTQDNNCTFNGLVFVTIAGDVTSASGLPDGRVDMRDIGAICANFMTTPSSPQWNPNIDINDDDVVNMRDVGIACGNFMKT